MKMDLFVLIMSAIMIPLCAFTILRVYDDVEDRRAFLDELNDILSRAEEELE